MYISCWLICIDRRTLTVETRLRTCRHSSADIDSQINFHLDLINMYERIEGPVNAVDIVSEILIYNN